MGSREWGVTESHSPIRITIRFPIIVIINLALCCLPSSSFPSSFPFPLSPAAASPAVAGWLFVYLIYKLS